jgi:hypothetical protein
VLEFFETSEGNLLPAELSAGVRHHVALSIVAILTEPTMAISAPRSPKRD